jgi:hypothetical protein
VALPVESTDDMLRFLPIGQQVRCMYVPIDKSLLSIHLLYLTFSTRMISAAFVTISSRKLGTSNVNAHSVSKIAFLLA